MLSIGSDGAGCPRREITPRIEVDDFEGVQKYRIVLWGEKSSLEDVLGAISTTARPSSYGMNERLERLSGL
jgi:hypothetical protein